MAAINRSQTECRTGCFIGRCSDFRPRMRTRHRRSGERHRSAPQLWLGASHDESVSVGRSPMRTMRRTDENSRRNTSAQRDTKNSEQFGASVSRAAPGARHLRFHPPHGFLLIVVINRADPCLYSVANLALNPQPHPGNLVVKSAPHPKSSSSNPLSTRPSRLAVDITAKTTTPPEPAIFAPLL
jgi:hypothetical protein